MSNSTVPCPHCGGEIRSARSSVTTVAVAIPTVGATTRTYDTDVDDFDYDQYVEENFPETVTNTQTRPLWRLVAVILLALFAMGFLLF